MVSQRPACLDLIILIRTAISETRETVIENEHSLALLMCVYAEPLADRMRGLAVTM